MAAGAARIIEIAFVLRDRASVNDDDDEEGSGGDEANSWQYLTPFVSLTLPFSSSFPSPLFPLPSPIPHSKSPPFFEQPPKSNTY